MLNLALNRFKEKGIKLQENVKIQNYSSIRCGGYVKAIVEPESVDELVFCLRALYASNVEHKLVGGMTNILPRDEFYDGIILRTTNIRRKYAAEKRVYVECGASLSSVLSYAAENSLGGAEELCGVPGTIGGGVYGNAGAYGKSLGDIFYFGEFYSIRDDKRFIIDRSDMRFAYRHSRLKDEGLFLLRACLDFEKTDSLTHISRKNYFLDRRSKEQPRGFPSLGSVFLRNEGVGAGYYIDRAGLKGFKVGGAMVSEKHAGFIINIGNATVKDILTVVDVVRTKVFEQFGIELIEEIIKL